ncbi:MAG TPA: DUF2917 domain-containing protein [Burkholderiaceae bacterium]
MLLTTPQAHLDLADDEVARLHDACDSRLEVLAGHVWLTVDGEQSDLVLGAGESYLVDSSALVTVSAIRGAARLRVRADVGGQRCRPVATTTNRPSRLQRLMAGISLGPVALA